MTQAQHTPGPWKIIGARRILIGNPADLIGQHLAYCAEVQSDAKGAAWTSVCSLQSAIHVEGGIGLDEQEANARLIAAAPELLAALEDLRSAILRHTDGLPDWLSNTLDHADEAIAKAKGGAA